MRVRAAGTPHPRLWNRGALAVRLDWGKEENTMTAQVVTITVHHMAELRMEK